MVCLAGVDLALILKMVRHFWALVSRACLRLSVQLKFRIKNFDIALCACCGNNTLYWLLFFWFYCCIYGVYSVICFNCLWKGMQYATSSHAPTISASISLSGDDQTRLRHKLFRLCFCENKLYRNGSRWNENFATKKVL